MNTLSKLAVVSVLCFSATLHAANPGWGKRSQIGQLARTLDRHGAPIKKTGFVQRQPLLQKIAAFFRPGLSTKDDIARIETFLSDSQAEFDAQALREGKMPTQISTLVDPALVDGRRMRAEKAIALKAFGRTPADVTETFIRTRAVIDGLDKQPSNRAIFVQRWKPIGKPSGKVFVIAPGFLETGRNYYEQAQLLNAKGHDVIIMDQQWAGYTADAQRGVVKGGVDRGFGVSRDVAEVAAYGNELMEREYGTNAKKRLVLVGTSMGAGPGVLGALALYDSGRLKLASGSIAKPEDRDAYVPRLESIPADRGYILQGAFFERTRSFINNSLDLLARVPGVRNIPLPAIGLPRLNTDPATNVKIAAHAVSEDIRARPQAFRATLADNLEIRAMVAKQAPKGRGYAIHAENDLLANPQALIDTVRSMKGDVTLDLMPGSNHVMEETAGEQREILKAAKDVAP